MLAEGPAKLTQNSAPRSVTVVVVGDDTVVGQALELLLRSAEYNVVFLKEPHWETPGYLDEVHLLVLAPPLNLHKRQAILVSLGSEPEDRSVPVVELIAGAKASRLGERHFVVPWPCRTEELRRQMEAALRVGNDAAQPASERGAGGVVSDKGVGRGR